MRRPENSLDKDKILRNVYGTSMGISMTAMAVVVLLELFMLVYTFINSALYGPYIQRYRGFYIVLLSVAVVYFALCLYVRRNMGARYTLLNVANPICTIVFFAWAVGITWSDLSISGAFDSMVFMTFSMMVPLSFYMFSGVYTAIVAVADACMLYLVMKLSGATGVIINLSIFFIFQIVLGISFLQLKAHLAARIVMEEENAYRDIMTGLANRRAYEVEVERLAAGHGGKDLIYIAIDINGLKQVNDNLGHDAGDRLIVGAAACIRQVFDEIGRAYRIGGDEFAVVTHGAQNAMPGIIESCEARMRAWSRGNGMDLSASYGYVCAAEMPGSDIHGMIKLADKRMYAAKEQYYQLNVNDRRNLNRQPDVSCQGDAC